MAQTFNPGGGPGQILPPPEVSGNPGQDPICNFGGDGVGPNANIAMALTEGSRKRVKADHGESGPVRCLVASQFSTVNAKLDNALKKVASQQNEIDHLRKKLDEAHDYNREQWNQFAAKWASMEKLFERLDNNREQPPRGQERLGQQPQTAQRMEGSRRGKPPPVPPRPREPMANSNININVNPGNQRPAHQQQQQQKKTTYATILQTVDDGNGGWNLVQDKTTVRREREHNQLTPPTQNTPMDERRMVFLQDQALHPACRTGEDYQSEINRALLKTGGPHWMCIRDVKRNEKGMITGTTTEMCTVHLQI
jgi:hypothetical protein